MATIYTVTESQSSGDNNVLYITLTNNSGAAWTDARVCVVYKYGTTPAYLTSSETVSLANAASTTLALSIGTTTYSATNDVVTVGVSFTGTAQAI